MERERPRRDSRSADMSRVVKRIGRVSVFVIFGALALIGLLLGIADILNADEPTYQGTFTEARCEHGGRYGCRSVGTWVSDDGRLRLTDVYLDGRPTSDGTIGASYTPTGLFNDADNNIVHGPFGEAAGPIVPWAIIALAVGVCVFQWLRWRGTWS